MDRQQIKPGDFDTESARNIIRSAIVRVVHGPPLSDIEERAVAMLCIAENENVDLNREISIIVRLWEARAKHH